MMKKYIALSNRYYSRKIYFEDVQYIEMEGHDVVIHTEKDMVTFRGTSKEMQKLIGNRKGFHVCHSYLIVNFNNMECMEDGEILFSNGEKKSIGKKNYGKTKAVFAQFIENDSKL